MKDSKNCFWFCHKISTYIKKNKGIKSCLVPKPLISTFACHSFTLLITLYTMWNMSNEPTTGTYLTRLEYFKIYYNCPKK